MKLDWRLTLITLSFFIALNPVISLVHEYGHVYVCAGNGYNYIIEPKLTGTYFACDKFVGEGAEELRLQMYLYGGLFGSATAFLLFVILHRTTRIFKGRGKGIGYALVVIGLNHFIQMFLETFVHDLYMESKFTIPLLSMFSLAVLLIFLARGSQKFLKELPKIPKYAEDVPSSIWKRSIVDIIKGRKPKPTRKYTSDYDSFNKPTAELLNEQTEPTEQPKEQNETKTESTKATGGFVLEPEPEPKGGFIQ